MQRNGAEPARTGKLAQRAATQETRTYLDHAATSPMRESARVAWLVAQDQLGRMPGNASALHSGGRGARFLLEDAREQLAAALGADRAEVVFTSGATESCALGVVGAAKAQAQPSRNRIQASAIEHPAVAEQKSSALSANLQWSLFPVDPNGVTVLDEGAILSDTALVTMCMVCSETGVIQPVKQLVELAHHAAKAADARILVHTDATQAVGNLPINFHELGADLLTLGGHKFGAPVGTGALLVSRSVKIASDRPGGGQERQIRSGTPDVAGALALAAAATEAVLDMADKQHRHRLLREQLVAGLPAGVKLTSPAASVPSIVHLSIPTAHPEVVLLEMDRQGVLVSAGSACHAGVTRPSPVLLAMGRTVPEALGVLRVSFGPPTTGVDVERFLTALPAALESARRMDDYDRAVK